MTKSASFNPSVHGARGLFAGMVFAFHIVNSKLPGPIPNDSPIVVYGGGMLKFGVELFFGISGYVIVGALARAPSIRAFLWDRAARIFPLLWLTLIAITVVSLAVDHWFPPWGDWALNFVAPPPFFPLAQVNPAAWSLGYEVTFYLLCAVGWHLRQRNVRAWPILAVAIGAALLACFPRAILMPGGMLIAAGLLTRPALLRAAAAPAFLLLVFLLSWRAVELTAPHADIAMLTPNSATAMRWFAAAPLLVASGVAGTLALLGIVACDTPLTRLLRSRPMMWLGTISFSFYLWQPIVMSVIKSAMLTSGLAHASGGSAQLVFAALALPPTLAVSHFSQRLVEVRVTRWLRRHGPREDRGTAPTTASVDLKAGTPLNGSQTVEASPL